MTDPNNGAPLFSFAIIADTHINDEEGLAIDGSPATGEKVAGMYRDLIERVNHMDPAFVVHLGDITHPTPVSPDYADAAEAFHKASKISRPKAAESTRDFINTACYAILHETSN